MLERIKRLPMAVKLAVPMSAAVAVGAVSVLAIGGTNAADEATVTATAPVTRAVETTAAPVDSERGDLFRQNRGERGERLRGPMHGGERGERGDFLGVAEVIGIDAEALKAGLESGQTLAEIAVANGSTAQAVIDHLSERISERLDEAAARLDEAEAEGKITAERAAMIRAELDEARANVGEMAAEMVNEGFGRGDRDGERMLLGELKERVEAVAGQLTELLGIDEEQLETELKAGKSLGEIATANGVEPQAVIDLLTSEAESMIDEALAGGEIEQAEADELREELLPMIGTFVNEGFRGLARELRGGFGEWAGGFGHDGFGHGKGERQGGFGHERRGGHGDWADRDPRGGRDYDRDWRGSSAGGGMDQLNAIAEAVGTDAAGLMAGISEGQSLADIARANGADPQVVTDLLISQTNEWIDAALEAGKISADEAAEMRAEFAEHAGELVEGTMDDFRRGFGFGKRGHDRDAGADADAGETTES